MSRVIFLALAVCVAVAVANDKYSSENDNFDIEALIAKPEEFQKFTGCFLEKNQCGAIDGEFKKDLFEVVKLACGKCTDAQKHLLNRYLAALKEKYPQDLEAFKKKYDPESKHYNDLEQAIAKA